VSTVTFIALTSDQKINAELHTTGPAGATFIPHVDENGNLSWTNNRGLTNPDPVNIKALQTQEINSAIASTTEALQTAYANIFSGRNLLENTNKGLSGWSYIPNNPVGSVYTFEPHDEGIKLYLSTPPSLYGVLLFNSSGMVSKLQPNTNYTLSFDLICNSTRSLGCMLTRQNSTGALTEIVYAVPAGSEEVEHIELLLTTDDLTEALDTQLVYINMPKEANKYWIIKNLKLEQGVASTPWVPAPEDAVSAIPGLTEKTASAFDIAERFVLANQPTAKVKTVTLRAANWIGSVSPYSQVVTIEGTTEHSKVDLTPTVEQLAIFHQKELAFVTENEDGVITVYAIGEKPQNDYTMPVTITEVLV
jgi:hypothetical protein